MKQFNLAELTKLLSTRSSTNSTEGATIITLFQEIQAVTSLPLYHAALLTNLLPKPVQLKLLDQYGARTKVTIDELQDFVLFECDKLHNKQVAFKANRRNNTPIDFSSPTPPFPCPICKGNHWKRDCPKHGSSHRNQTRANLARFDHDLSSTNGTDSDYHESHTANPAFHCQSDNSQSSTPKDVKQSNNSSESFPLAFMATTDTRSHSPSDWYLDSGASDHLIANGNSFSTLDHYDSTVKGIAGGVQITGKGTVQQYGYTISNAYYAPDMPCNLLSVSQMTKTSGQAILFLNLCCSFNSCYSLF